MQGDGAQPAGMETESKLASGTGKHFEFTIFVVDLSTILLKTQTEKQQKPVSVVVHRSFVGKRDVGCPS